jgi:hypothetical protein
MGHQQAHAQALFAGWPVVTIAKANVGDPSLHLRVTFI